MALPSDAQIGFSRRICLHVSDTETILRWVDINKCWDDGRIAARQGKKRQVL